MRPYAGMRRKSFECTLQTLCPATSVRVDAPMHRTGPQHLKIIGIVPYRLANRRLRETLKATRHVSLILTNQEENKELNVIISRQSFFIVGTRKYSKRLSDRVERKIFCCNFFYGIAIVYPTGKYAREETYSPMFPAAVTNAQ